MFKNHNLNHYKCCILNIMRIKIFLLFAIFITTLTVDVSAQFALNYKNAKHIYTINLPKTMKISEYPETNNCDTMIAANDDGSTFSVIVYSDKVYKGVTSSQLSYKSFMPDFKIRHKNIELKENDYTDIAGNPAMYMKVDYKNEEEDGTVSQFLIVRNEKLYILRINATKENYDKFVSEISGYIFTFQFMESSNKEFYKNDLYNFVIYFPIGWSFDKGVFPVQANSPKGSSLYIEVLKNNEFKEMTVNDLDTDILTEAFQKKFSNLSMVGKKKVNIDGNPTLQVKYRWVQTTAGKKSGFYVIHYYLLKNNLLFVLQGLISDTDSKDDEKQIERSVESFQFTK